MSSKIVIPLFPYMALSATLKIGRFLVDTGARLATRESEPARYLLYIDRTQAHGEYLDERASRPINVRAGEVKADDLKRFRVRGRSFLTGWCSAAELDSWKAGRGNVAIRCVDVRHDTWLSNANSHKLQTPASPAVVTDPPFEISTQDLKERMALKCSCGRTYTWAEYLELAPPAKCTAQGVSDQVESEDEDGHPVLAWLRDCSCKNTMCRPKPEGAR